MHGTDCLELLLYTLIHSLAARAYYMYACMHVCVCVQAALSLPACAGFFLFSLSNFIL